MTNIGTQKMVYMAHRDSAAPRPCDPYRPFFSSLYLSQELNFGPYIPYIGPVDQVLYSYIGPANLTMQILGTDSHIGPADQVLYSYIVLYFSTYICGFLEFLPLYHFYLMNIGAVFLPLYS